MPRIYKDVFNYKTHQYEPKEFETYYHPYLQKYVDKEIRSDEMRKNNPRNEPTGHFTGRCSRCGSNNLWDDNLHYGCNSCGACLN